MLIRWIFYLFSFSKILGWSLLSAIYCQLFLCIKSCFISKLFSKERLSITSNYGSKGSNPYFLIYNVLKFDKEHKCPVHRSALTFWENKISSRINLGKRKHWGPFTNEENEDVKTFLQLLQLLFSLSGILIALYLVQIGALKGPPSNAPKSSYLITAMCQTLVSCEHYDIKRCYSSKSSFMGVCIWWTGIIERTGLDWLLNGEQIGLWP